MRTPRTARAPIVATVLLALVVACHDLSSPGEGRQTLIKEMNRREALWKGRGFNNYDFLFEFTCECDSAFTKPVRIRVRGGLVAGVSDTLGTEIPMSTNQHWPTIDSLFNRGHALLNDKNYTVAVAFHDTLDYVTYLAGDLPQFSSDEFAYLAGRLVAVAPMVVPRATAGSGNKE